MALLTIIGGPNGSGKTTLSKYLIQKGRIKTTVINPDEIAFKEFGTYEANFKAGKLALERRRIAKDAHVDFAFETTFSGNTEINEVKSAKGAGYTTVLYFIALSDMLDNIIRVDMRQANLGHSVGGEDIIRRYTKSQSNLIKHLALFDKAYLFDNSGTQRSRVAMFDKGKLVWLNNKHKDHPFYKGLL